MNEPGHERSHAPDPGLGPPSGERSAWGDGLFDPEPAPTPNGPGVQPDGGKRPPDAGRGADDPWAPRLPTGDERAEARARRKARRRARAEKVAAEEPDGVRYELRSFLELAALTGFAIVLPVLGSFGESPETFVGAGAESSDIVAFALRVALVPLALLVVIAGVSRLFGSRVRRGVQLGLIGVLAAAGAVPLARQAGMGAVGRVVVALAVGIGLVAAYRRWRTVGMFLRCAAATPAILVATFLFASPVSTLVNPPAVEPPEVTGTAGGAERPDLVVIMFDELPTLSLVDGDGAIDAERFPNLARLAGTSTWFRNHNSVAPETLLALPAFTTGKMPLGGTNLRFANYDSYPDNIFSLLGETHEVHATEWATDLCPPTVCSGDEPELDADSRALIEAEISPPDPTASLTEAARTSWLDQIDPRSEVAQKSLAFPGSEDSVQLAEPGLRFLSGLQEADPDTPVFDWLHMGLPHQPWRLLPSGNQFNGPDAPAGSVFLGWSDNPSGAEHALAARTNHLLQLQWTDRYVGEVLDRLEEIGRFDDAVVVVTADHGVAFSPGGPIRDLAPSNTAEISYTPLLIKAPGQSEGVIDDSNVSSLDVLPTVADYLGIEIPWDVDGKSLVDGGPRDDNVKVSVALNPIRFPNRAFGDVVFLEADGLGAIKDSPFVTDQSPAGLGADGLNVYRHGRHGDLLGQRLTDLTTCTGGPEVDYRPPSGWESWAAGTFDVNSGKVPLYHEGSIDAPGDRDVAIVVDGVVAGWGTSRSNEDGNPFSVLLAEPLTLDAGGTPEIYEIQPFNPCLLRHLRS